jgi:hypothetical protein
MLRRATKEREMYKVVTTSKNGLKFETGEIESLAVAQWMAKRAERNDPDISAKVVYLSLEPVELIEPPLKQEIVERHIRLYASVSDRLDCRFIATPTPAGNERQIIKEQE